MFFIYFTYIYIYFLIFRCFGSLFQNIYHRFYNPFLYTDFSDMRQYNATDKIIELLNAFSSNRENLSNKEYTNKFSKDYIFEEMNKYRLEDK